MNEHKHWLNYQQKNNRKYKPHAGDKFPSLKILYDMIWIFYRIFPINFPILFAMTIVYFLDLLIGRPGREKNVVIRQF